MVEVIHEHDTNTGNGMGVIVGVLIAIALIFFLFYYFGRGLIGSSNQPQINIPDKVNVDINQK